MARRTLNDGLTPEQEAFLANSPVKPTVSPSGTSAQPAPAPPPATAGMVGLHTRIEPGLHDGLLRASMDRKLQRRPAATVQDIVGEALTEWLKKAGYLG